MENSLHLYGISIALGVSLLAVLWGIALYFFLNALHKTKEAQAIIRRFHPLKNIYDTAPVHALVIHNQKISALNPKSSAYLGLEDIPSSPDIFFYSWLDDDSAQILAHHLDILAKTGRAFHCHVHHKMDQRLFKIDGQILQQSSRDIILWIGDITQEADRQKALAFQAQQSGQALQALSSLFEVMPFPIWYRNAALQLQMVNQSYVTAVESPSAREVITRNIELTEGKGANNPVSFAEKALETKSMQSRLSPVILSGTRRMMRLTDIPLPTGAVAGYALDVEALEEAKAEMGRFLQAQRHILDQLSAGVAQFNAEQNLVFANEPFRHLFALKAEWLTDHPEFDRVLERMREAGRLPAAHDFPAWKAERRQWFLSHNNALEENWLLMDGSHLRVITQPTPDGGLLLIFEDRTEQVRLTSAHDIMLRVRTASFDKLFEAIGVFASDGRLNLWNTRFTDIWQIDEKWLSTHPRVDDLAEKTRLRLENTEHSHYISDAIRMTMIERQPKHGHIAFIDQQHFNFSTIPLPDGNILLTMLDVTDSWRMERALRDRNEALEAADRLKTDFVANMSYELRTPLTSISGFAEMLAQGYCGDLSQMANDYVAAILDAVARLSTLIDDILDLTLLESGNLELDRQNVDIKPLLQDMATALTKRAEELGIHFEIKLDDNLGMIESDPQRLSRAINHMLLIALARNPRGGTVQLQASGAGDHIAIVIVDDADILSSSRQGSVESSLSDPIFDHFSEYGQSVRGGKGSSSIAIPLIRRFIALHGGSIHIDSNHNQKTHFIITLPRHVPAL
ncbi:MAG: PAS-domain containing protein [Zymomonas mobilis]|uniref:sensor histidine kinase n=1 Tax=Zymomonas mobilis TaxID=542 RepID=UPI00116F162D